MHFKGNSFVSVLIVDAVSPLINLVVVYLFCLLCFDFGLWVILYGVVVNIYSYDLLGDLLLLRSVDLYQIPDIKVCYVLVLCD
jgi:hypothetical protein